jgi:hypothetical protein
VEAKHAFEAYAKAQYLMVNHHNAFNGRFVENIFTKEVRDGGREGGQTKPDP